MEYRIVYSKRKTVAIKIKGADVIVCAPSAYKNSPRMTKELYFFVEKKRPWIEKKLAEYTKNTALLPGIRDMSAFYWHGKRLDAEYKDKIKCLEFDGKRLIIPKELPAQHDKFYKKLRKTLADRAESELYVRLADLAVKYGFRLQGFGISNVRGKWGSCSSAKNITLNWRLALLNDELIDYVIVHELCHTVQMNHSAKFWCLVELYCPNYKTLRRELKKYGFLTEYLR